MSIKSLEEMTKTDIIEELQSRGATVNPQNKKEDLYLQLQATSTVDTSSSVTNGHALAMSVPTQPATMTPVSTPVVSDTDKILAAIQGLAIKVDTVTKRVDRMEDGGKNEFKTAAQSEDVEKASAMKSDVDPKIVKIVEDTLGVDFGVQISGFQDRPGFQLDLIVPKRLSSIPDRQRPIKDKATGEYVVDPKTGRSVEETYWPGDKRSVMLGSTASYDVIQQHCNRVRSYIVSFYQKANLPLPSFNIK